MIKIAKQRLYPIISLPFCNQTNLFKACCLDQALHPKSFFKPISSIYFHSLSHKEENPFKSILLKIEEDPLNLLDSNKKKIFYEQNKMEIQKLEKVSRDYLGNDTWREAAIPLSSFINVVSMNEELNNSYLSRMKNRLYFLGFSSLVGSSWYVLLSQNEVEKKAYFSNFYLYLRKKIPINYKRKVTLDDKYMLTQILYNTNFAFKCRRDENPEENRLLNLEYLTLEIYPLNFYLELSEALKEKNIIVESICKFDEIYNLGIELKDKVLLDFYDENVKGSKLIYKVIRHRNLTSMGYQVIPIILPKPNMDKEDIVNQIMEKIKT